MSDGRAGSRIRIEDVEVKMLDPAIWAQGGQLDQAASWKRIFLDDFENYGSSDELLRQGGWVSMMESSAQEKAGAEARNAVSPMTVLMRSHWTSRDEKTEKISGRDFEVSRIDSLSGVRSLKLEKLGDGRAQVTKVFALPQVIPFDVSEKSFAIVNQVAEVRDLREVRRLKQEDTGEATRAAEAGVRPSGGRISGDNLNTMIPVLEARKTGGGELRTFSAYPTGTYYIYAFDGRLLAEYNDMGFCVRDYIYLGGKMVAEYRSLENRYYYYGTDQIGSTRIVTGDNGEVVYAAAHDPYGGVQHTWTNTYDPSLKFSGKERDLESGLDYFGARYYDRSIYRFLTVDPIIPAGGATANPQRWNLYAYCGNNPVSYVDPDGSDPKDITIVIVRELTRTNTTSMGSYAVFFESYYGWTVLATGYTLERGPNVGKGPIPEGEYEATIYWWAKKGYWTLFLQDVPGFSEILMHPGESLQDTEGCILVGKNRNLLLERIGNSRRALKEILKKIDETKWSLVKDIASNLINNIRGGGGYCPEFWEWVLTGTYRIKVIIKYREPRPYVTTSYELDRIL